MFNIPNTLTLTNLFAGCVALLAIHEGNYYLLITCIVISLVADFLDGFAAKIFNQRSELGLQLDSLADMVSFGAVPGFIYHHILSLANFEMTWIPYLGFFITLFSALRLAKFNIDTRQIESFIGLATPANAIFITGLLFLPTTSFIKSPYVLLAIVPVFCYLLISEIPMFSLKKLHPKENIYPTIFGLGCIVLLTLFQLQAISLCILLYLVLSFINNITKN